LRLNVFETSEIFGYTNKKGEYIIGAADEIKTRKCGVVFTKRAFVDAESEGHPTTNGWIVVEWLHR
jgi:hypothetical protein